MNKTQNRAHRDNTHGLIFNIQKFSLHDGSGIRTLVFLKGCPLACKWCSNPEGQSSFPELAYNANKCIGTAECTRCLKACTMAAIQSGIDGKIQIDRTVCNNCGQCVGACPSKALELFGKYMSVDDVIAVVEEDSTFYTRSGGGLTVSGGEPLSQAGFVVQLLKTAQGRGTDTALESSGLSDWEDLGNACRYVNQVFYDIKSVNREKHKAATGVDNKLILENFQKLRKSFPHLPLIVRTPVIPGFNDSPEDIRAIADFLKAHGSPQYELLAYHRFGEPKYEQLGKEYPLHDLTPPTNEHMISLRGVINLHTMS